MELLKNVKELKKTNKRLTDQIGVLQGQIKERQDSMNVIKQGITVAAKVAQERVDDLDAQIKAIYPSLVEANKALLENKAIIKFLEAQYDTATGTEADN